MRYCARVGSLLALCAAALLGACGDGDGKAAETLPPIATTTTTTTMPPTTTTIPEVYVIQRGDSLFGIAEMFNLTFAELAAYNGITNPDDIQAGQKLKIPQPGETTTSTVSATVIDPSSTTVAP